MLAIVNFGNDHLTLIISLLLDTEKCSSCIFLGPYLESAIPLRSLNPFSRKWHLETII